MQTESLQQLQKRYDDLIQQHKILQTEHHEVALQWSHSKVTADKKTEELEKLQSQFNEQTETLRSLQDERSKQQNDHAKQTAEIKILQERLKSTTQKNEQVQLHLFLSQYSFSSS